MWVPVVMEVMSPLGRASVVCGLMFPSHMGHGRAHCGEGMGSARPYIQVGRGRALVCIGGSRGLCLPVSVSFSPEASITLLAFRLEAGLGHLRVMGVRPRRSCKTFT